MLRYFIVTVPVSSIVLFIAKSLIRARVVRQNISFANATAREFYTQNGFLTQKTNNMFH